MQLLAYSGYFHAWATKQTESRSRSEDSLRKTKEFCAKYVLKYGELNKIVREDVVNLRAELAASKQELLLDFTAKVEDLGSKCAVLSSKNEALQKVNAQDGKNLMKALALNAEIQAEVDSLKKEAKSNKKKKLEVKIAELMAELSAMRSGKDQSDQMTKVSYQDGFCLARHQVLLQYPELDLSHLSALDFPKKPRGTWSKPEFLNLPPTEPVPPTEPIEEDDAEETLDAPT